MFPFQIDPPRVLVIGSINMDLVARVPRIPLAGETLTGSDLQFIPGGKGANQAVAAARLGASVRMCGRLGDDAFASTLRKGLHDSGVNTDDILTTPECSSGVAWISVDASGSNSITVIPGSNGQVLREDILSWEPAIRNCDVILLQLEIPPVAVASVIELARRHHVRVVVDLAPVPTERLPDAIWQADLVSPNQVEAAQLVGFPVDSVASAEAAAAVLLARGPRAVIVKLGGLGALLAERDGSPLHIPAIPIQPIDTTAAGDAFTATVAVAWAGGVSLAEAVRWGCLAGAAASLQPGAQPAMPTVAALQRLRSDHGGP